MKRVLVITYYWPPTGGSGVQRWVKFAKYLPLHGWQPVIYTPENPEMTSVDHSLEEEIPQEAEIIKTKIVEPYGIWRMFTGQKKNRTQEKDNKKSGNTFAKKASMWIRGNFFIPDPRCLWIGPSVRFLKRYLKEHPVDIIVSTGPPQSMHLIARKVSLATGIPWIADFRDPWTKIFYFKHLMLGKAASRRHAALEKKVLDDATAIVAVSPLVQKDFQEMTSTPVHLITNGFDECDFDFPAENDGYFNVTHTGLLTKEGNPVELWKALADKCRDDEEFRSRFRLILVGKTDKEVIESISEAGLDEFLHDHGYQNHSTAVRFQKNASLLILPIREEPETKAILPGKLFEYLAAGKPILGVGTREGAMAQVLHETESGVILDWTDRTATADYIEKCWSRFKEGKEPETGKDLKRYSRKELTRRMAELLDSLISR